MFGFRFRFGLLFSLFYKCIQPEKVDVLDKETIEHNEAATIQDVGIHVAHESLTFVLPNQMQGISICCACIINPHFHLPFKLWNMQSKHPMPR